MKDALVIEMLGTDRTLAMVGYAKLWQSSQQQTVCSVLSAKVNPDGSIDIEADFESNGGISFTLVNISAIVVWA